MAIEPGNGRRFPSDNWLVGGRAGNAKKVASEALSGRLEVGFGAKLRLAADLKPQQSANRSTAPVQPSVTASGSLTSDAVRRELVFRLQRAGGAHPAVLSAIEQTHRHTFVDAALASQAYEDTSLPIGYGQTISKPSVVARMLSLLLQAPALAEPMPRTGTSWAIPARVLEIGTGCGYQAALLAQLAMHVTSVERIAGLHERAQANLAFLNFKNLRLLLGDGMLGAPESAPFVGIIAAAGGDSIPSAWVDQLLPGGRIVAPVQGTDGEQWLTVADKSNTGRLDVQRLAIVRFVPLKSGTR